MNTASREASDWLSPIIIKELRQGMRGRTFLSSFLLIQVAMMFCASGALIAASATSADQFEFFSGLFWFIIAIPLLGVLPWIGNTALGSEMKANSLELIYLTRLTPWRIVAGKWAALFAQSLLFVFSVLPYLVLRYFLGGVNLLSEVAGLGFLLVFCAILTAITVGFSAHNTWMVRGGLFLFLFFGLGSVMSLVYGGPTRFWISSASGIDQNPYVLAAVFVPLVLLLMLEVGTARIAPAAISRSFNIRALGLLFLIAAGAIDILGQGSGLPLALIVPPLLLICFFSLCESPRWIRSIYTPYTRKGFLGRTAGRLLFYPGWSSAFVYTTVLMLIYAGLQLRNGGVDEETLVIVLVAYSALIFPVAVTRLFQPGTPYGLAWFIGSHIAMLFVALMMIIINQAGIFDVPANVVGFLPTSLALLIMWDVLPSGDTFLYSRITSITIILSVAVLVARSFRLLPLIRKMEA